MFILMLSPKESMNKKNNKGPKTEPCGTSYFSCVGQIFIYTKKWQLTNRYDINQTS